jgi:hypothetical protein
MKISAIPKRGRKGFVIYSETRHGKVARQYVRPRDPNTPDQLANRSHFGAVSRRWRTLTPEHWDAWRVAALTRSIVTKAGRQVRPNGYHYFVSVNTQRADLGLPQFDLPPAEPVFSPNPVTELVITDASSGITLKLRVTSPPAQYTLVQGAQPVRTAVRFVQHYTFLGLLPPPIDGWSDITNLFVARYGVPKIGMAVWIRTCQHIDGWTDVPKVVRSRVPTPPA